MTRFVPLCIGRELEKCSGDVKGLEATLQVLPHGGGPVTR